MRSRYSRRIYSMKFGNSRSSDYVDDEDLKFLESLVTFHKSYLENSTNKLKLDLSLLEPKLRNIYQKIHNNFSVIKTSESTKDLYHNLDLSYEGEEHHLRNIREQIINYLNNKKHQIFTNHRVEFLINIALNTENQNLHEICKEIIYDSNNKESKFDESDDSDLIEIEEDTKSVNNMILTNLAKMDTLLLPYISMFHPKPKMNYDEAHEFILDTLRKNRPSEFSNNIFKEKIRSNSSKRNHHKQGFDFERSNNHKTPHAYNNLNLHQLYDKQKSKKLIENNRSDNSPSSPNISTLLYYVSKTNKNSSYIFDPLNPIISTDSNLEILISPHPSADSPIPSFDSPSIHCEIVPEVIEISDEDPDDPSYIDDKNIEQSKLCYNDIDRMIDFLIHRCNVNHNLHPSLLRNHQMAVELNGFLLFVNFSIRFSLKYPLNRDDHRIFECIFISSITVGLASCVVNIDQRGINIDRLTNTGLQIVSSRLRSVQIQIKHATRVDEFYSVVIDPDITRLVNLTLFYMKGYHDTGELIEKPSRAE